MKCTSHEGVVVRGIAKHHQLGTSQRILLLGLFCRLFDDVTHQTYCIHVDARLRRTHVDAGADALCGCQCLGDATNEQFIALGHAFRHNGRITTQEIHTHLFRSTIERRGNLHIVTRCTATGTTHQCNRRDTDTFVDNGDSKFLGNVLTCLHKVTCQSRYLLVYLLASHLQVRASTVQKVNTHRDSADIKVLLLYHLVGLNDFL